MKKKIIFILLCFLGFGKTAYAMDWVMANQATISWNAVTTNKEGGSIAAEEILYKVYAKNKADGSIFDVIVTTETQATITFSAEGKFVAGVQTVRKPAGNPDDLLYSDTVWSDSVDVVAVPEPFGFVFLYVAGKYYRLKAPAVNVFRFICIMR